MACRAAQYLLLKKLQGDLSDHAFQDPARLLVQLADLLPGLCLSRVLLAKFSFKDLAKESDPRSHLSWAEEVGHDFDLQKIISSRLEKVNIEMVLLT